MNPIYESPEAKRCTQGARECDGCGKPFNAARRCVEHIQHTFVPYQSGGHVPPVAHSRGVFACRACVLELKRTGSFQRVFWRHCESIEALTFSQVEGGTQ